MWPLCENLSLQEDHDYQLLWAAGRVKVGLDCALAHRSMCTTLYPDAFWDGLNYDMNVIVVWVGI